MIIFFTERSKTCDTYVVKEPFVVVVHQEPSQTETITRRRCFSPLFLHISEHISFARFHKDTR